MQRRALASYSACGGPLRRQQRPPVGEFRCLQPSPYIHNHRCWLYLTGKRNTTGNTARITRPIVEHTDDTPRTHHSRTSVQPPASVTVQSHARCRLSREKLLYWGLNYHTGMAGESDILDSVSERMCNHMNGDHACSLVGYAWDSGATWATRCRMLAIKSTALSLEATGPGGRREKIEGGYVNGACECMRCWQNAHTSPY